jgi:hypothetical protein
MARETTCEEVKVNAPAPIRYLRTLLILLAVGPIFLAVSYWAVKEWQRRQAEVEARAAAMARLGKAFLLSWSGSPDRAIQIGRSIFAIHGIDGPTVNWC